MVAVPAATRLTPTMRQLLSLACVALAFGLCRSAAAVDLYRATAPLQDASDAARSVAVTDAFGRVLAQVAGRQAVAVLAQQPTGSAAAQRALVGFASATDEAGASTLEARFEPRSVREFLAGQQVPTLPDARPTLLLWLLAERDGAAAWVGADEPPELAAALTQAAAVRGLPVLLPVLDLEERAQLPATVDPADPASLAALGTAAARYRPDGVLFGRLQGGGASWQADLRLAMPGRDDATWSARGATAQTALDAGFDQIGTRLAPAATPVGGPVAPVELVVEGVADLAAYARVREYLRQVPGLRGLRPLALGNDRAAFHFELAGGAAALASKVEPGAPFTRPAGDSPAYRYQP